MVYGERMTNRPLLRYSATFTTPNKPTMAFSVVAVSMIDALTVATRDYARYAPDATGLVIEFDPPVAELRTA